MSEVATTSHSASIPHAPPDLPTAAEATARETFPAPQAAASFTKPAPVVSKSVPDSAGAATPGMPTELALSSPGVPVFPLSEGGNVKIAARNWADSAIVWLGASTDDAEREAIRQEAIRVAAFAQALGSGPAEKLAQEIIMRVNRAMGLANPRRSAGRPKRGNEDSDPVLDRGSINLPGQSRGDPADGRATEAGANNRPTGRTISAPGTIRVNDGGARRWSFLQHWMREPRVDRRRIVVHAQREAHCLEEPGDGPRADVDAERAQLGGNLGRRTARPLQAPDRVAGGLVRHQGFETGDDFRRFFPSAGVRHRRAAPGRAPLPANHYQPAVQALGHRLSQRLVRRRTDRPTDPPRRDPSEMIGTQMRVCAGS